MCQHRGLFLLPFCFPPLPPPRSAAQDNCEGGKRQRSCIVCKRIVTVMNPSIYWRLEKVGCFEKEWYQEVGSFNLPTHPAVPGKSWRGAGRNKNPKTVFICGLSLASTFQSAFLSFFSSGDVHGNITGTLKALAPTFPFPIRFIPLPQHPAHSS